MKNEGRVQEREVVLKVNKLLRDCKISLETKSGVLLCNIYHTILQEILHNFLTVGKSDMREQRCAPT